MKCFLMFIGLILLVHLHGALHVIGDSHSAEFSNIDGCIIHYLGPRTMHRIGRDGLAILDFKGLNIQENDVVVLAFGEIDVRCHIGKQRDYYDRDLNEIIDVLLENYFKTILMNRSLYEKIKILTYTVTPPIPEVLNPDYESYGSIQDRVFISKLLNQKLVEKSILTGIGCIDVYDDYADERGVLIPALSDGSLHIHSSCSQNIKEKLYQIN
jgi:hypothetical protein